MTDPSNSADPPPDLTEIENIAKDATSSAAVMNKSITSAYHRLSLAAHKALNAESNLDWCGFAKWASHTVGRDLDPELIGVRTEGLADAVDLVLTAVDSILDDRLPRVLQSLLKFPRQELHDAIRPAVEELVRNDVNVEDRLAAKALRASNALIFGEIGSVFARLLERLGDPGTTSPQSEETVNKIANEIVPDPVDTPVTFFEAPIDVTMLEESLRGFLVWAVDFYLRAAQEADQVRKGELMLAGSMMFTQYEQQRVDHLITIGTCVPIRSKLIDFLNRHLGGPEVPRPELLLAKRGTNGKEGTNGSISDKDVIPIILKLNLLGQGTTTEKTELMAHIISIFEEGLISALTQHILFLEIADQRVRLGLPEQLPHPTVPLIVPTLPDVKAVMDLSSSPVKPNWIDLHYRLEFIGKYFAAYQLDPQTQKNPSTRGEPPPPV